MTPFELNIILDLLKQDKLKLNSKFRNTKLFETNPIKFSIGPEVRLNLLYCYLRHVSEEIMEYFYNLDKYKESSKEDKIERFQYKIILCKKMIYIIKHLESAYGLNLSKNSIIFENIIRDIKSKLKGEE